ncbi:unnamed protein product [Bursaphelenchus xylophilus]|nr:unnamed protein product [Bursaphelenchus xylophilus]CAG9094731.1 unnamed protein product [Bursaphelenchus xylophilus]
MLALSLRWFLEHHRLKSDPDILKRTYVDNILSQAATEEELVAKAKEAKQLLSTFRGKHFDPEGLTCPLTLPLNLILQATWSIPNLTWDDPLPPHIMEELNNVVPFWETPTTFRIPRKIINWNQPYYLHAFTDGSKVGIGILIYLAALAEDRTFELPQLIMGKSRVAPKKANLDSELTIPTTEIVSISSGVLLLQFVEQHLPFPPEKIILWNDSRSSLESLIRNMDHKSVFVKNRLRLIRDKGRNYEIRHVPGKENSADIPSRGIVNPADLVENKFYWHGPKFLQNPEDWPSELVIPAGSFEEDQTTVAVVTPPEPLIDPERFGSWSKLHLTARIVINFTRKLQKKPAANNAEVDRLLFLLDQQRNPPSEKEITDFRLFQDQHNLWRCDIRLQESDLPPAAKTPIWLPNSHQTRLIIRHYHNQKLHAGVDLTLCQLRTKYWVKRSFVRKTIKTCSFCKRQKSKPFEFPPFAPLPQTRCTQGIPFDAVGVDTCGPFKVKDHEDVHVLIFSCLKYRVLHTEVIASLQTTDIIHGFTRFISRRGPPSQILSDNHPSLCAAKDFLQKTHQTNQNFCWSFITPRCPWEGASYERIIAELKRAMKNSGTKSKLDIEEFRTLISRSEEVVNSRPLTAQSDDVNDLRAIKPFDFIGVRSDYEGDSEGDEPEEEERDPTYVERENLQETLRKKKNRIEARLEKFKTFWIKHYLQYLAEKNSKKRNNGIRRTPIVGELTLVADPTLPRQQWKLGRIQHLNEGRDGIVRTADVLVADNLKNYPAETSRKIIKRNITQLYSLEITPSEDTDWLKELLPQPDVEIPAPRRSPRTKKLNLASEQFNLLSINTVLMVLSIVFMLIYPSEGYNFCPMDTRPVYWRPTPMRACSVPYMENLTPTTVVVYQANHVEYKTKAYICSAELHKITSWTDIYGFERSEEEIIEKSELSAEECWRMKETRKCIYGSLSMHGEDLKTNTRPELSDIPNRFMSLLNRRDEEFGVCKVLSTLVLAHFGSTEAVCPRIDLTNCKYEDNQCRTKDDRMVVWIHNTTQNCPYIKASTVKGVKNNQTFISEEEELMLTFSNKRTVSCQDKLWISDQGVPFQFEKNTSPKKRDLTTAEKQFASHVNLVDLQNTTRILCDEINQQGQILNQLIASKPAEFAQRLLNRTDVKVQSVGHGIVSITFCTTVPDEKVHFQQEETREFRIKVNVDGKGIMFLDPVTEELHLNPSGLFTDTERVVRHNGKYFRSTQGYLQPINVVTDEREEVQVLTKEFVFKKGHSLTTPWLDEMLVKEYLKSHNDLIESFSKPIVRRSSKTWREEITEIIVSPILPYLRLWWSICAGLVSLYTVTSILNNFTAEKKIQLKMPRRNARKKNPLRRKRKNNRRSSQRPNEETPLGIVFQRAELPRRSVKIRQLLARGIKQNAELYLVNSDPFLESGHSWPSHVIPVGGAHIDFPKPLFYPWNTSISSAPAGLIIVQLGANVDGSAMPPALVKAFVGALSKLTKFRIYWRIGTNLSLKGVDLENMPSHINVTTFIPQNDLLAHRRCKLLVTNGGSSSILEALTYGVPILGVPLYGVNYKNLWNVEQRGAGLMLNKDKLDEKTLLGAMKKLLDTPIYKKKAENFAKELKSRPGSAFERVLNAIELVARHGSASLIRPSKRPQGLLLFLEVSHLDFFLIVVTGLFFAIFISYIILRTFLRTMCWRKKVEKKEKQKKH